MQLRRNKEMEFETLKKNYKKQMIIGALAVCIIGGVLTFATSRAKYKLTQDINIVKGTINYKPYDFKVMAMYKSEDGTNYTEINDMPSSGYVINEDKTYCTTDNKTQVKGKIKTVNGVHGLYNITKSDKCYLYFDKYVPPITMDSIIASFGTAGGDTSRLKSGTPTFSTIATGAENTANNGIYMVSDGMYGGTSYYWRGAATTNYVKFAGFCWRIVRINGDKTMRLIYDGTTCHANGTSTAESIAKTSIAYNTSYNQSNYVGWTYTGTSQRTTSGTASNAKTQLESWYSTNITGTNATKVAQGKYCNDRNAGSGYTWAISPSSDFYYAAYTRRQNNSPTLSCPTGDVYTLNVGLITMDEAMYAGGIVANNTSYYLYNGQNYWTMSPYNWDYSGARVFYVNSNGGLGWYYVGSTYGLRPVINLKADTLFATGGTGTQSNPYVVQ